MKRFTFLLLLLSTFTASCSENTPPQWRKVADDNLVYMQTEKGLIVMELTSSVAPIHVERFKALISEGFYDGLEFYRVIDGFVAQAGDEKEAKRTELRTPLGAEFTRKTPSDSNFILVQDNAFLAPQTGYLDGFAAGHDPQSNEEWLLHCPGHVAFARGNGADTATTEFYIVIGQATRHLDRNMSSVGRVVHGMEVIQSFNRAIAGEAMGVITDVDRRSKIEWAKLGPAVAESDRLNIEVMIDDSADALARLESARTRDNAFFHYKGNGNLDMCYYQLRTRVN